MEAKELGITETTAVNLLYEDDTQEMEGTELGATKKRRKRHPIILDTRNLTAKSLFEVRAKNLPLSIRRKLGKYIDISDHVIFATRKVQSDHVEMFLSSDAEHKGALNLNRAMLPAETAMLLYSITLLQAAAKDDSGNDIPVEKADFQKISAEIANGWFSMSVGQQIFFDKVSNEVFRRNETNEARAGEYILETPKLILPQQEIQFNIDLGTVPSDVYVKVALRGVITVKA